MWNKAATVDNAAMDIMLNSELSMDRTHSDGKFLSPDKQHELCV
jgi:hypothetical protein